jgi:Ni,Fe-hydrogenase I cytochrome b subunit
VNGDHFNPLQRLLHWVMAICILSMLFIGVGFASTITSKYLPLVTAHKTLAMARRRCRRTCRSRCGWRRNCRITRCMR